MKKEIIILGTGEISESLYPHLYDFVNEVQNIYDIKYLYILNRAWEIIQNQDLYGFNAKKILHPGKILLNLKHKKRFKKEYFDKINILQNLITDQTFAIIGIDHIAINLISEVNTLNAKLIFWSYDIISPDTLFFPNIYIKNLLKKNIANISKFNLIVIQDYRRGAILDFVLKSYDTPKFYFPISLKDDIYAQEIADKNKLKPNKNKPNLLQLRFEVYRGSVELLEQYQKQKVNYNLFYKGNSNNIDSFDTLKNKPIFLPFNETYNEFRSDLSKIDIGFICYNNLDLNTVFISYASGQFVEFIRFGIPLIVYQSNDLGDFVENQKIGIFIENIEEIDQAINKIMQNYSVFSENSRITYKKFYDLNNLLEKLVTKIEAL